MRLFGYYIVHTVINGIKKVFRTWVALVFAFALLCGVLGGIVGVAIGSVAEDEFSYDSTYEEEEDFSDLTAAEQENVYRVVELVAGGIVLAVLLCMVYTSDKSGTNIFTMPDVNLLFTAPLKPQSVLLFRLLLQMGGILVGSVYLLFNLPNLIINLGLSIPVAAAVIGCWLLTLAFGKLLSVLVYTLIATHEPWRRWVRIGVFGLVGVLALAVYGVMQWRSLSVLEAAMWLFGSPYARLVPGWGWLMGMVGYALDAQYVGCLLCAVGVCVLCGVLVYFTWRIKADFYEDALAHAAQLQETQAAAAEGRNAKRQKERADRLRRDGLFGQGASVFLTRGVYNHHRFGKLWLFSTTGITYFAVFVGLTGLFYLLSDGDVSGMFTIPAVIVAGMAFFRNLGNPIEEDMRGHLLYLVPERPGKKLVYAMLAGSYDTLLDATPGLLVAALLLRTSLAEALGWLVFILTLDFLVSTIGLLLQMGLPGSIPEQVRVFLQLMLKMLLVLIPVVVVVLVAVLTNLTAGLYVAAVFDAVVGGVLVIPAAYMLHAGRS